MLPGIDGVEVLRRLGPRPGPDRQVPVLVLTAAGWPAAARVTQLTSATREIARGNFETTLPTVSNDEIGQLTESIAMMSRQISGLVHQQQRFVSDAAHEITSPVSRLQIALELLQREQSVPLESKEERELHLAKLAEDVLQMSELVQDLLYYYSRAQRHAAADHAECECVCDGACGD